MQTILVLITFAIALGYLLKKFVWTPVFESRTTPPNSLDGNKVKCGKKDCGCH
ncbi:hypothetical protein [Marinirhabdus gelatinilytica]|uniref:hypothetical protein n=1 Tax=Marinirhabdus gelatinilytica TaxID=1703343 RepID=UPI001473F5AC|nr:hypothetical protein [Marinirhabdus gelatinilytica]